jgi:hypothetical protein
LPEFGFLKSRVYAKLLRRLILKRYQAFNRYPLELGGKPTLAAAYRIGKQINRYAFVEGLTTHGPEMPQDEALASGIWHGSSNHG